MVSHNAAVQQLCQIIGCMDYDDDACSQSPVSLSLSPLFISAVNPEPRFPSVACALIYRSTRADENRMSIILASRDPDHVMLQIANTLRQSTQT